MKEDYNKPFKTYKEQLEYLKSEYKLNILNEAFALNLLRTISYYDLINGYKECFFENNIFKEGTEISHLFSFKILDRNIQNVLFKYSVYVENIFKTKLAYILAKNYGISTGVYLDENNFLSFNDKKRMEKRNSTIETIRKVEHSENNPTRHYKERHNHIPPWILFKNVNFTDAIDLYTFLRKKDKKELIQDYCKSNIKDNNAIELLKTTISIVRKFRNKIAHNSKVITYKTKNKIIIRDLIPNIPRNFVYSTDYKNNIGVNDMFAMISSLVFLLNNDVLSLHLANELKIVFDSQSSNKGLIEKYKRTAKIPVDIDKRLDKLIKELENNLNF